MRKKALEEGEGRDPCSAESLAVDLVKSPSLGRRGGVFVLASGQYDPLAVAESERQRNLIVSPYHFFMNGEEGEAINRDAQPRRGRPRNVFSISPSLLSHSLSLSFLAHSPDLRGADVIYNRSPMTT